MKSEVEKFGLFSQKVSVYHDKPVLVDLGTNPSIQEKQESAAWVVPPKVKQVIKVILEQGTISAQGGAVLVNYTPLVMNLMGYKVTTENHKHLAIIFLSYTVLRARAAGLIASTDLKNKAPDAIKAYILTEKNVLRMLTNDNFIQRMQLPFGIASGLKISFSVKVVSDQVYSAKAWVEGSPDPSGASFQEIKAQYQGQTFMIVLMVLKEMLFRGIPMGAAAHTAGNAFTSAFVDSQLPVDPPNQEEILKLFALIMAILGAISLFHPLTNHIAEQVRALLINIGLVFWASLSMVYYYDPQGFQDHSLLIGILFFSAIGILPSLGTAILSDWNYQDKIATKEELQSTVEEVIEEEEVANSTIQPI